MTCPHYKIKISSRKDGHSSVAQAAYQSGDRLYDERDHRTKYYRDKRGITHTEIILPPHAPQKYKDRNTLWNAVEAAEPNWNSQLARRFEIALPIELSKEASIELIRQHCLEQFVSKGMIADIAIHDPDPPGHNPHAHVMLTMRPIDENGNWMKKAHKEYVRDENGERIRTAGGNWKTRKVNTTDWNDPENAERWRHAWEVLQNQFLEMNGRTERICMRSYRNQGVDKIPMIHMGPAVTAMERNGTLTDIGNLNREIRETNHLISSVKRTILLLMDWLSEIRDVITEINAEPQTIYLAELLARRFEERKQERIVKWQSGYSIQTADQKDLKCFADIIAYMHETKVLTITDLQERFASLNSEIYPIRKELKQINRQLNHIRKLIDCMDTLSRLAPIQEEYSKIFWKRRKEQFAKEHKEELKQWYKTNQYIKEHCRDGFPDLSVLKHRISSLEIKKQDLKASIEPMQSEMNKLSEIRYYVMDLIPELMPNKEPMTAEKITAKRESLLIRLDKAKEESAVRYNQQHTKIREEDKCTTLRSKSNEQTM